MCRSWVILAWFACAASTAHAAGPYFREVGTHDDLVRWVGYSPDGKILASASFDGTVRWTDAASGKPRTTLKVGRDRKSWGAFSADGSRFVAGSAEPAIRIWSAPEGKLRRTLSGRHTAAWAGAMTPDGATVVSGGPEGTLAVWDAVTGNEMSSRTAGAAVWWLAMSPEGDAFIAGCGDGRARIYALDAETERLTLDKHAGGIYCVAYAPDGSLVATAGADSTTRLWDAQTGELKHALPHFGAAQAVAFSPDSRHVAVGGSDHAIEVWDARTGAFVRKLTAHREPVWSVAFDPSGKRLLSGGADGKLLEWDLEQLPLHLLEPAGLPPRVDLRPRFQKWNLRVVSQHSRGTCSVHTFTRALEFAVTQKLGKATPLSDEYLNWGCNQIHGNTGPQAIDRGQFFEWLWMAVGRYGFCPAAQMPWRDTFDPTYEPSGKARQSASHAQGLRVFWHEIGGPGIADEAIVREIKAVLVAGSPVLAGSSHSVLVVGYIDDERNPGGGRFLIADSGIGGYITEVTADKLHSAIAYDRVRDYGFSWLECAAR